MADFEIDERVDITDVVCPMTFVKAKVAMEEIEVGQILAVTMNDGEPVQNVPRSFKEEGQQILKLIDRYTDALWDIRALVENKDTEKIFDFFSAAKDYRDSITIAKSGPIKKVYEFYCDLIDEAGGIATIATILASNNLSIKNIGILHNREFENGVLHIEMYEQDALNTAIDLLKKYHYTVYER